jgi:hypothetical protein
MAEDHSEAFAVTQCLPCPRPSSQEELTLMSSNIGRLVDQGSMKYCRYRPEPTKNIQVHISEKCDVFGTHR